MTVTLPFEQFAPMTLDERRDYFLSRDPGFAILEDLLFELGGSRLIYTPNPPDPKVLLDRGVRSIDKRGMWVAPEQAPSACHALALAAHKNFQAPVYSGYALSEDGKWREHSWVTQEGLLLELTGIDRVSYFGVKLKEAEFKEWFSK